MFGGMRELPFRYPNESWPRRGPLKPWLLFALTLAVLAFCTTVLVH